MDNPPTPHAAAPPDLLFPVVGIGASAGGLEAYSQLLRYLPADTGMAYVLVQHLDPTHPSHLVELLTKVSRLPVVEAHHHQPIQPDHVYIIPPDALLTIDQGTLHLQPRPEGRGLFMPVDAFLSSLAEERGRLAIGVILSGTGSDGTLGIKAIKAEGGITFAQDSTAPHEGMPRSAISSACVDFVLPPEGIARELLRVSRHPYVHGGRAGSDPAMPARDEESLATLFQLLRKGTRVEYVNYKRSTILRRIQRRLLLHRLDRLEDYLRFLNDHPEELAALHQDLLIHVTRFFRDPQTFDALAATVFPDLAKHGPPEEALRIWVPGCSTGEEVYSLAIRLLEFLGHGAVRPIKIFATDISDLALERARTGRYLENIRTDVSEDRLQRFFVREEAGYQIVKGIRDLCVFARHDMTGDPPFSNLDLISCRNVLIYLAPVLQKRVLPIFHYALKDHGFLLLGGSETIGTLTDLFSPVDARHRIYARKAARSRLLFDFTTGEQTFGRPLRVRGAGQETVSGPDIQRETDRLVLARYAPPGVVVNEDMEILQTRGQTGAFLALPPGTASLNLLKMARPGLLLDLRAALEESRRTGTPSRREGVRVQADGRALDLHLQVIPLMIGKQRCFTVLFEQPPAKAEDAAPHEQASAPTDEAARLQQELAGTKEYLQSIIEQLEGSNEELKAANEEILSSNEELQSTNEELQTAKEELQATNEELNTVNEELQHRNREAMQLGDDLTNLFRSINIPIVMVGQDLRVRRFTPSAAELFSLIPGDVGRPIADIKPKLVDVDLGRRILAVLETLRIDETEVRDQQGRWHLLSLRPYRTQDSRIDGAVVSVQDIDALKRNEETIKQARDHAENVISTMDTPLLVLDPELRVVSANTAFYERFGTTPAETVRRPLAELGVRAWCTPQVLELLHAALQKDKPFRGFEVQGEQASGRSRTFLVSGRRLLHLEPGAALLLVRIEDITDQRRLEDQLRQAQKMEVVGLLAAGVAHDFNNLLTVINGYAGMVLGRVAADPPLSGMVAKIGQAGERAAAITRQLLAFSRKSIVAPRVLDLAGLLADLAAILPRLLGENIVLDSTIAPGLGTVRADPSLIEQVLLNLALNARDAMPDGGTLTVHAGNVDLGESFVRDHPEVSAGPYIQLTVRDTGSGMTEQTLAHAFEPFYTTKEVGKGTGLGLASVYGSIKQSDGHIFVQSRLGAGTEFSIYLPRLPSAPAAGTAAATPLPAPQGQEVLLLVEDAHDVRALAKMVLAAAGYTVLEASDGREALDVAQAYPGVIHLLVTDVVMPRMGGRQLADRLIVLRPDLKVLYVSGYTDSTLVPSGAAAAAVAFLPKPYTGLVLTQAVRALLDGGTPKSPP